MTGADRSVRSPSPEHGEHGDDILAEIGLAPWRIEDLRRRGIIGG
jgi:crotonobetainyl-CoA:carnitine CoA-transferase CaiB-like acyl-CoA transferase